jgi:hypothetical protein
MKISNVKRKSTIEETKTEIKRKKTLGKESLTN